MRIFVVAVALLGFQDEVAKGWTSPWSGVTAGTRLKWKVTGQEASQKFTRERAEVVTAVEADSVSVEETEGEEKNEQQYSLTAPSELEGPWKKSGDEELKVGDRTFKCAVYECKKDEIASQTTRVWKSADSPHWAVKATFSHVQNGMELLGWTEDLIQIGEGVTAAGKEVKCRVVRRITRSPGIELTETTWWTDEIPGHAARRSRQTRIAGTVASTHSSELLEVRKK